MDVVVGTLGLCVPHTWSSVVATVKDWLVSPAAKVTVPLWPLADQLTVSGLATLSPLARERFTVKVRAEPSAAEPALGSEERGGGKEGSSRAAPAHEKTKQPPRVGGEGVGLERGGGQVGLWWAWTWELVVAAVKVLLVSPAAKVTVPLWPLADQLTVSGLATLSPLARERFTVKVRAEPSVAEAALALTE